MDIISKLMVGWIDLLRNKKLAKWKETYKYLNIFLEFIQFGYAGCEYEIKIKLRELFYLLFLKRRKIVEHDSGQTIPTKSFMNLKFCFIFTAYSSTRIYISIDYRLWEKSTGVLNWNNKYMYHKNELNNNRRIPCLIWNNEYMYHNQEVNNSIIIPFFLKDAKRWYSKLNDRRNKLQVCPYPELNIINIKHWNKVI